MFSPERIARLTPLAASVFAALALMGCASGSKEAAVPNPFIATTASKSTEPHIHELRVFGDSYSDLNFTNSRRTGNWVQNLRGAIGTDIVDNYAIGGARAADANYKSFNRQIDTMVARNNNVVADSDLTIVYLGHNDINKAGSPDNLAGARRSYTQGVDRLISMGAANTNSRLFLTQLHDWSRNPGIQSSTHPQVVAWNNYIAGLANAHENVIAVDMYTAFERVFENPGAFGFTNVKTPDSTRSAIDALFNDTTHFGSRGQQIISRVYEHYLTRGWNWANTLSAGASSATRLGSEVDRGILSYASQSPGHTMAQGFNLIPIGALGDNSSSSVASNRFTTPASQGVTNTTSGSAPKGIALNFAGGAGVFGTPGNFGFAYTRNGSEQGLASSDERLLQKFNASASTLYWHQPVSDFLLTTQVSNLRLDFENNARDELLNRNVVNNGTGSTWSFEQKIRRPMGNEFLNFTPWVSFAAQSHKLDPYWAQTLYTTATYYNSSTANDLYSGIGFDLQFAPVRLSSGRKLNFSGGINHSESLRRSSVAVAMTEANQSGLTQRETILRPNVRSTLLGLNASLDYSKKVNFSASYGADLQSVSDTQQINLLANLRF